MVLVCISLLINGHLFLFVGLDIFFSRCLLKSFDHFFSWTILLFCRRSFFSKDVNTLLDLFIANFNCLHFQTLNGVFWWTEYSHILEILQVCFYHCSKVNITMKQVIQIFWFQVHLKVNFALCCSQVSVQCMHAQLLSLVQLFAIPWTVTCQISGKATGVGCCFFLQGIFPTQTCVSCIGHLGNSQVCSNTV